MIALLNKLLRVKFNVTVWPARFNKSGAKETGPASLENLIITSLT